MWQAQQEVPPETGAGEPAEAADAAMDGGDGRAAAAADPPFTIKRSTKFATSVYSKAGFPARLAH